MKYKKLFQEYFKQILDYKGYIIFDTEHSVERFRKRVGFDMSIYFNLLKKGIHWITQNGKQDTEDRYIFISKKYGFGIQVHWRQDRYSNKFNGYSATTFSKNEMNFFTKADKKLFLENYLKDNDKEHPLFETYKNKIKEILKKECYFYEFKNELKEETDLINLDLFIEDGRVYKTYEFIEI